MVFKKSYAIDAYHKNTLKGGTIWLDIGLIKPKGWSIQLL